MQLVTGINHVAVMTEDLDRFIDFYTGVFELEVLFEETNPAFRHAILRTGPSSWLHPAEVPDNPHGHGIPDFFQRGHLDHVALRAHSRDAFEELRRRLVQRSACDGSVDDLGAFHSLWFDDPDGQRVELTVIVDAGLEEFHEPRRLVDASS
jgi:catechol 2,3-dioxygenase-like lactoylglutathione lyase family enzyme